MKITDNDYAILITKLNHLRQKVKCMQEENAMFAQTIV